MNEAAGNQPRPTTPGDTGAVMSVLTAIGRVPLVGREAERRLIAARLAESDPVSGGVILISGEPGVGKTRLAQAVTDGFEGAVVRLRCDEYLRDVPYSPFLDWTEGDKTVLSPFPAPIAAADSTATPMDRFEPIHQLLVDRAGEAPCVILIDQMEWIDAASVDLLRYLVRRGRGGRRVVLATIRIGASSVGSPLGQLLAEWNRERLLLEIPLGPLDKSGSDELVRGLLGMVEPHLPDVVYARTDGLPFFIEEFVRQLVTEGHTSLSESGWQEIVSALRGGGSLPFGIAASVVRQLDHVPPATRQVLHAAAVLGTRCHLRLLGVMVGCPEDELIEDLSPAVAMRLFQLESDDGRERPSHGSFTHALVREGLYAALPRDERHALHGRASEVLSRESSPRSLRLSASVDAAMIAYHAERAHEWSLAYEASLAAGDAALDVVAGQDAFVHFNRARGFVRAGHLTVDATAELALDYRLVSTLQGIGRLEDAAHAAREMAARAAEVGDRTAEAWALIQIAGADTFSERFAEIETGLEQGRLIADKLGDAGLLATALATRGILSSARGLLDDADEDFRQAIPLAEQAGKREIVLKGITYAGLTASWRGRYQESIARCEEAIHMAESMHDAAALADARFSLALSLGGCGEYERALATLQQLLDLSKTLGEPFYAARVPNTIGWIYRELALVEQALPWDELACTEPDDYGGICHFKATANSLINLGTDLILLGRPDRAEDALNRAEGAVNQSDYLRWRSATRLTLAWGELALARGRAARALDLAADALAQATATDSAKHVHQAHDLAGRVLAASGRHEDAVARLEQAVSISGEIGYLAGFWRSLAHLGDALLQCGRRGEAHARFIEAAHIIDGIAENLRKPELRADFLAASEVRAVLARAESGEPDHLPFPMGLSEREVEVLRLVADGLTNVQIADHLYISPKTVSSHLVNIFAKLGVTSRASATRIALEHGLA
ncbi:MAG TPA: AAA family ATPase [Thermomicrobiales bacterium]|nr:AAA family ATPase [Thermomicrobiales bacterium]